MICIQFLVNTLTKKKKIPKNKTLEIMVINKREKVRKKQATSPAGKHADADAEHTSAPIRDTGDLDSFRSPETWLKAERSYVCTLLSEYFHKISRMGKLSTA